MSFATPSNEYATYLHYTFLCEEFHQASIFVSDLLFILTSVTVHAGGGKGPGLTGHIGLTGLY